MAILTVGPGKTYSTIAAGTAAAQNGDTIQVLAGTYYNDYALITKNITLEGVGGMVKMVSTGLIPNGKAILIINSGTTNADVTISNFEFSGAKVADHNGEGIRHQGGDLVLNNCYFHDNEEGLLSGDRGTLTVNNCEFANNGYSDDQTHDLYVGRLANLTINNSYFHGVNGTGQEVKSRALNTSITNSRIYDLNSTASYSIDLPNGGNAVIKNNVIEQGPYSPNNTIISYGVEDNLNPGTNFVISGNTILNDKPAGSARAVWNATTTTAQITDDKFFGLTPDQIAHGPSTQSGNQFLTTEPALDKTHPWSSSPIISIALASDTGSSSTDEITSNPAIKGVGQVNTVVRITEGGTTLGTTTAGSTGAWSFTPNGLADGAHTLVATQTDLAGNTGTATLNFTLDTTAPTVSMALASDTGSSSTDGITSNPAVEGTAQANTAVTITEGGATLGTTTADSTGAWSFTPSGLADGAHTLVASQTDLAGNTGTATLNFTFDSSLDGGGSDMSTLTGTEGDDVLTGTFAGLNVIYGLGGNDTISVQNGNATTEIYGGDGDDIIKGSLWGDDYLDGGPGNDRIYGNWGSHATIIGGAGNDYIDAGGGSDTIYGGPGDDTIFAGGGSDTIYDEQGINRIDGGGGNDTAVFTGNHTDYSLTFADGVATVAGSQGTSTLTGIETLRFHDGSYDAVTGSFLS